MYMKDGAQHITPPTLFLSPHLECRHVARSQSCQRVPRHRRVGVQGVQQGSGATRRPAEGGRGGEEKGMGQESGAEERICPQAT